MLGDLHGLIAPRGQEVGSQARVVFGRDGGTGPPKGFREFRGLSSLPQLRSSPVFLSVAITTLS